MARDTSTPTAPTTTRTWYGRKRVVAAPAKSPKKMVGRYVAPEVRGRVTAKRPVSAERSPRWFGPFVVLTIVVGMLLIILNYLEVLPGSASPWYLAIGLVVMFAGFFLATQYK